MRTFAQTTLLAHLAAAIATQTAPFRLQVDQNPVRATHGYAAPLLYDFDHDGARDLLVGQFGGGRLAIHRNLGNDVRPRYADASWFEVGGAIAKVPAS